MEKLEYLMNLTKTTNEKPVAETSLDLSYFSHLYEGEKAPAKNAGLRTLSSFFAIRCSEKSCMEELLTAMNRWGEVVRDARKLEDLIFQWLSIEAHAEVKPVKADSEQSANFFSFKSPCENLTNDTPIIYDTEVYYGNEGRRKASIKVLCEILKRPTPCTMLLLSEENLDWMIENDDYLATWTALLQQAILRGHKIKIVHHIGRDMKDLMVAIKQWIPIYMSGVVEPYYNPNVSEMFFRRTLFVAPDCAAIFSNSVVGAKDQTANYLVRDKKAVNNAVLEFEDYLAFCQPLFHICGEEKVTERQKRVEAFDEEKADTFLMTNSLADLPMPAEGIDIATSGLDDDKRKHIISLHQKRVNSFKELLSQNCFHVVLDDLDFKTYNKRLKPLVYSGLECQNELIYTTETIKLQIKYLIHLLKSFENFHIYLTEYKNRIDHVIYGKVDFGVLIIKAKPPTLCFSTTEGHMTAALWNHMRSIVGKSFGGKENKKRTIRKLDALLKEL